MRPFLKERRHKHEPLLGVTVLLEYPAGSQTPCLQSLFWGPGDVAAILQGQRTGHHSPNKSAITDDGTQTTIRTGQYLM